MYVRFTIPSHTERTPTGAATGIFHAAWELTEDDRFEDWAYTMLDDEYQWFADHMPVPKELRLGRAICWFRPEAREAISHAWQMAKLVESVGVPVRVYRKVRPGTIVYEDDFQVAALPWRTTFRSTAGFKRSMKDRPGTGGQSRG
jgi:hypothetical protein